MALSVNIHKLKTQEETKMLSEIIPLMNPDVIGWRANIAGRVYLAINPTTMEKCQNNRRSEMIERWRIGQKIHDKPNVTDVIRSESLHTETL